MVSHGLTVTIAQFSEISSLKSVGQLDPKSSTVARNHLFGEEWRRRIAVAAVEQVVDAPGKFEALEQILAEERQVGDVERICDPAGPGRPPARVAAASVRGVRPLRRLRRPGRQGRGQAASGPVGGAVS